MSDLSDVSDKWTVVQIDPKLAIWEETRGKWAAYPPEAGWGEWIGLYDTWEQAYARAYWEAINRPATYADDAYCTTCAGPICHKVEGCNAHKREVDF